jgi:putative hemolysin
MVDFFIVLACLVINAFFSAYEMAFVTVSREEMEALEERASIHKRLSQFKKKPERTLSVIQIGITFVGAVAAAVGGTGAVDNLEPYIVHHYGLSHSLAEAVSVALVIVPLTYFSVVFGELVPKTIALKHPLKVINLGTNTLCLIDNFLSPIVSFLETSTNFFLKRIGLNESEEEDESMGQAVVIGDLPDYHQRFVQNLVALKGRKVQRAMIPWDKVTFLGFSDSEEEARLKIFGAPYSRFPVVDSDVIVGILHKKELPDSLRKGEMPWQGILRPTLKVQEQEKVLEAFLKMQDKQIPLAVVVNNAGERVGIITIEDIIEEVVGDINDRSDFSMTSKLLSNRAKINIKK